jgi:VWFA-related protein
MPFIPACRRLLPASVLAVLGLPLLGGSLAAAPSTATRSAATVPPAAAAATAVPVPTPPAAPAPAEGQVPAATPATQEVFVEQVEVRVVNLDVVVVDRDGNRVTGLGKDDFEVREDGQVVAVTNFLAYDAPLPASPPTRPGQRPRRTAPSAADPQAATYAVDLDLTALPPPLVWAFYVDQERLEPGPRSELFRELRDFAARAVGPRDFALAASFNGQALELLSPLAQGPEAADRALEKAAKQRGYTHGLAARRAALQREIAQVDAPGAFAASEAQRLLLAIDNLVEEEVQVARRSLGSLRDLLSLVSGVEGRVILVLGGAGYDTRPGEALYRLWQGRFGSLFAAQLGGNAGERELDNRWVDIPREYGRLLRAANAGRFTAYTIHAGGGRGPNVSAEGSGEDRVYDPFAGADPAALGQAASIAGIAETTGGRSFISGADLDERMEAVRLDLASYYSLGYRPARERSDGYHRVDVRVRREGLRVLHRAAVTVQEREEQAASSAVSALLAEGPLDNLYGAVVEVGTPSTEKRRGGQKLVPITVKVPLREVVLLPAGNGKHQGKLRFHFALRDDKGAFRRLDSKPLVFDVPDDQLAVARGQHVAYRVEVPLPAGSYRFATAIEDELGGTSGVAAAPVVVAK